MHEVFVTPSTLTPTTATPSPFLGITLKLSPWTFVMMTAVASHGLHQSMRIVTHAVSPATGFTSCVPLGLGTSSGGVGFNASLRPPISCVVLLSHPVMRSLTSFTSVSNHPSLCAMGVSSSLDIGCEF